MLRYKRGFAIALCVLTTLTPVTALAAGLPQPPEATQTAPTTTELAEPSQTVTAVPTDESEPVIEIPTEQPTEQPSVEEPAVQSGPRIVLNWKPLNMSAAPVLQNGTMFVPVRAFCELMSCSVTWLDDSSIYVTRSDLALLLTVGSREVWANGRHWYMDAPCQFINGHPMIPIRTIAKIFSCTVSWWAESQTVYLRGGSALTAAEEYYNADNLLWLARIIWCEAGNQPLEGKVAVGNVILNRVKSPSFPDTIYDVIFDRSCGVQFTPTASGNIYCTPPESCYEAARLALEGYETAPGCLYFVSVRSSSGSWASRHRTCFGTIGNHVFYL